MSGGHKLINARRDEKIIEDFNKKIYELTKLFLKNGADSDLRDYANISARQLVMQLEAVPSEIVDLFGNNLKLKESKKNVKSNF